MVHVALRDGGGLIFGLTAFDHGLWLERQPYCHRWTIWRTRVPQSPPLIGPEGGDGTSGVREPRRPAPHGGHGAAMIDAASDGGYG